MVSPSNFLLGAGDSAVEARVQQHFRLLAYKNLILWGTVSVFLFIYYNYSVLSVLQKKNNFHLWLNPPYFKMYLLSVSKSISAAT